MEIKYDDHIKVILWGGGRNSQNILKEIKRHWRGIDVIGIADNGCYSLNKYNDNKWVHEYGFERVLCVSEVKEHFQNKKIDGVIIGTQAKYYDGIKYQLEIEGIDVYEWKKINVLEDRSSDEFYHVDELYLKSTELIGWTYTKYGDVYNECTNGRGGPFIGCPEREILSPQYDETIEDACPLLRLWTVNYFHFMHEIVDKLLLCEENGYKGKYLLYNKKYIRELVSIIGIDQSRIIYIDSNDERIYRIINAMMAPAFSISSKKGLSILKEFADKLRESFSPDKSYPDFIYVKRIGVRKAIFDEEILSEFGIEIMIPEEYPVEEQIKFFQNAKLVITPHGAAGANSMYMSQNAFFVETFPRAWINPTYIPVLVYMHINYRMIVESGIVTEDRIERGGQTDDYVIDGDILRMTIQECIESIGSRDA